MAEFTEVMKQFKRMCVQGNCHTATGCPMPGYNISNCRKFAFERPAEFEKRVMDWAAGHPELVYPTWLEWMTQQGLCKSEFAYNEHSPIDHQIKMTSLYAQNHVFFDGKRVCLVTKDAIKPIPAEIAEKLGIEPKEG